MLGGGGGAQDSSGTFYWRKGHFHAGVPISAVPQCAQASQMDSIITTSYTFPDSIFKILKGTYQAKRAPPPVPTSRLGLYIESTSFPMPS